MHLMLSSSREVLEASMAGMTAEGDVDREECTAADEEDGEESGRRRWSWMTLRSERSLEQKMYW